MRNLALAMILACLPLGGWAQDRAEIIRTIVEGDILPGFARLAEEAHALGTTARADCTDPALTDAYERAFRTWSGLSHLRFGPSEEDNRAYALAFWPDPRGKTPKAVRKLLAMDDTEVLQPERFKQVSVAARGFYALDFILFDDDLHATTSPLARCALTRAIAQDIAETTRQLYAGWTRFAPSLINPGPDTVYRTETEVLAVLFKASLTGLQFSHDMRLGRPLGTFDRPRPKRAEARRSGQSLPLLRHAVRGSGGLAIRLAAGDADLARRLTDALSSFEARAVRLDDPVFAGVATPQGRIRIEALQTDLNRLRAIFQDQLGAHLGVSAGFNALDGD